MTCAPKYDLSEYDQQIQEVMQLFEASSPERQQILSMLLMMLSIYKGNRDAKGRFRKTPALNKRFREYLLLFKGLPEYQTEAFQAEIAEQLELCDEMDAPAGVG